MICIIPWATVENRMLKVTKATGDAIPYPEWAKPQRQEVEELVVRSWGERREVWLLTVQSFFLV